MANVRVNEIPLIDDEDITDEDSTLVIDKETRATKRISIHQLTSFISSGLISLNPKGPEYALQFNSGSALSGSENLTYNYDTDVLSGTVGHFNVVSASVYQGISSLPDLDLNKISTNTSITLTEDQRAVFASNSLLETLTITLPDAATADSGEYYVIKSDSQPGSIVVEANGSGLINGSSNFELNGPFQSITLITDGTNWYIF